MTNLKTTREYKFVAIRELIRNIGLNSQETKTKASCLVAVTAIEQYYADETEVARKLAQKLELSLSLLEPQKVAGVKVYAWPDADVAKSLVEEVRRALQPKEGDGRK